MDMNDKLHAQAALTVGKIFGTHSVRGWVGPRADLDGMPLPGFEQLSVQSVALFL
jgi:hypothetical protein